MKEPVFKKNCFTLCTVPVPKGYPQSQTHCGISQYDGLWYMTTSPFPTIQHSKLNNYLRIVLNKLSISLKRADRFENPCLYIGDTNQDIPTNFYLVGKDALMKTPAQPQGGYAYNSDPDLFIEEGVGYILNRTAYCHRRAGGVSAHSMKLHLIKGNVDRDAFEIVSVNTIGEWNSSTIVSHCLTKYKGSYYLMYLDTISALDGKSYGGLFYKRANTIEGLKDADVKQIKTISGNLLPWHMSLFQHKGILYTIIACVEKGIAKGKVWQMLGEFSEDLSSFSIYNTPLTDYCSYRGSATITPDGEFVLYTPTWNEKVSGSNSVDGKDILMARMPFADLLNAIKNEKSSNCL